MTHSFILCIHYRLLLEFVSRYKTYRCCNNVHNDDDDDDNKDQILDNGKIKQNNEN